MANTNERVDMIGASILTQAENESRVLIDKANHEREHALAVFEEQIIQDMFGKVQKQAAAIRLDTTKTISTAQAAARQAVFKKREEVAGLVFLEVKARFAQYTKTAEYKENVMAELAELAGEYDHAHSTVYIREADKNFADEIENVLAGCKLVLDPAIRCGGWKLENSGAKILIDEALETRLEEQKAWFELNSGLSL